MHVYSFSPQKQDLLRMNVAPDLNNHLQSIDLFRNIDQKFVIVIGQSLDSYWKVIGKSSDSHWIVIG